MADKPDARKLAEDAHFRIDELARSQATPEHLQGAVQGAIGAHMAQMDAQREKDRAQAATDAQTAAQQGKSQHEELIGALTQLAKNHGELVDAHKAVLQHLANPPDRVATADTPSGPVRMTIKSAKEH